ncbi:MAG: NAD(P)H-hydrate dehydratase [Candidatus Heimdallarchaeota archaeon]|nr:NAD(P)H-hydrate dehydratase [Candidatus Heimdallarchaeota archaeon]
MVITSEEVRIIDSNSDELGVSVVQLMENAGASAARVILEKFPDFNSFAICCGTGNNGGDGMVVARHLASQNKTITLILVGQESKINSEATLKNFSILKHMEHSVKLINITDSSKFPMLKHELKNSDLIIDSLLGIGISSEPYEPIRSAIKAINNSNKKVLSIDLPSGMWSDIPKKTKLMVNADLIVTFHDIKPCLMIDEIKEKTIICNIGVPKEAEIFIGKGDLKAALPDRKPDSHKGENGTILVVGGSIKYSGAPILTSRAALRTGADLVITCIPDSIAEVVRSDSPNMIVKSLPGDYLLPEHEKSILEIFEKFDSMVIGPGSSENPETAKLVVNLIRNAPEDKPIIIDADALKAIKADISILKNKKTVLTPHFGEFYLLFEKTVPNDWFERMSFVKNIADKYSTTILLKSKYDVISDGLNSKANRTGHAGMTVGGTGDVLAGILGTLSAINKNLFRATCGATYLAGKAGEYAAEDFGNSLLATDVIEKIPDVILSIKN